MPVAAGGIGGAGRLHRDRGVAPGQHDPIGLQLPAVTKTQSETARRSNGLQIHHVGGDALQLQPIAGVNPRLLQHRGQVEAEHLAGKEAAGVDGPKQQSLEGFPVELQPAQQMARIAGVGAHVARRDVEQMARIGCAVGQAGAEPTAALDQQDRQRPLLAQQVGCHQGAAESRPHHGDHGGLDVVEAHARGRG